MTRDEAQKLQVGKDKIWVVGSKIEEIFEMDVTRVELETPSRLDSMIKVTGNSKAIAGRVYMPSEIHKTELDALQRLGEIYQLRSDQALGKKHGVVEKIAKLKARSNR